MGIEKLDRYINNENLTAYQNYTLDSIRTLLGDFDNPHKSLNTIHIAGTNGKGSIAYMLNSVFIESGYKTGLFTSPHLLKLNERIKIDNIEISDNELGKYSDDAVRIIEDHGDLEPTFFDIITLIAFKYFKEKNVDIAVIEAGLGGRLDSTNVINPLVSVITDISLDHISTLGDNISKITYEKAGIIKKMTPVVTSNITDSIVDMLKTKADEMGSRIFCFNRDFKADIISMGKGEINYNYSFHADNVKLDIPNVRLKTFADFQVKNSSTVITSLALVRDRFKNINNDTIRKGILNAVIPGRFQVISEEPSMIFDPAHNQDALAKITAILRSHFSDRKIVIIISLMKDKNYIDILDNIQEVSNEIIYYNLNDTRGYNPSIEKDYSKLYAIVENRDDLIRILTKVYEKNILFFFTGSFRLYRLAIDCASEFKLNHLSAKE